MEVCTQNTGVGKTGCGDAAELAAALLAGGPEAEAVVEGLKYLRDRGRTGDVVELLAAIRVELRAYLPHAAQTWRIMKRLTLRVTGGVTDTLLDVRNRKVALTDAQSDRLGPLWHEYLPHFWRWACKLVFPLARDRRHVETLADELLSNTGRELCDRRLADRFRHLDGDGETFRRFVFRPGGTRQTEAFSRTCRA